jgi:mono/diheme cytochrome c family protein
VKSHARIMLVLGLALAAISAQAQPAIERGRYLFEGILTCGNCHSPRGPDGIIDGGRLYSGGPQTWDERLRMCSRRLSLLRFVVFS